MEEKYGISTKKFMVAELEEKFSRFPDFIITNYKGSGSQEIEKLRRELRKSSSGYCVVKNSLAKRTLDRLDLADLSKHVKGEVGIGFIGDVVAASKTLVAFSRNTPSFRLGCAFIDGKVESADRIKELAMLPPRGVLLGLVVSYMKGPITGFAGVLGGLLRSLVHVFGEIKKKQGKQTE